MMSGSGPDESGSKEQGRAATVGSNNKVSDTLLDHERGFSVSSCSAFLVTLRTN